ncbi:MAG: PEP-utilizing enzyme [Patescibacteria group bacterium]
MQLEVTLDKSKTYVANRVGELTDFANPLTYSLISKIFGYRGPYRKVLSKFGVGNYQDSRDYLVYVYGRIYSDLAVESNIIWEPSMFELTLEGRNVVNSVIPAFRATPKQWAHFTQKFFKELHVFLKPQSFIKQAANAYEEFSATLARTISVGHINTKDFLAQYEHIVFISYLHGLFHQYNNAHKIRTFTDELTRYVHESDVLISGTDAYMETKFSHWRFEIGYSAIEKYDFSGAQIPWHLEFPQVNAPESLKVEAYLQCLRNNLRFKTQVMLYFLNKYCVNLASKHCFENYDLLTLNELETMTDDYVPLLAAQTADRKIYEAKDKRALLPDIINNGDIGFSIEGEHLQDAASTAAWYKGISCSPGTITGHVQYITDPSQSVQSPIAMFPNASTEFTKHFREARGLVFKTGSPLAHGAIVARELKVPAIILDVDPKYLISKNVTLDGDKGILYIVNEL